MKTCMNTIQKSNNQSTDKTIATDRAIADRAIDRTTVPSNNHDASTFQFVNKRPEALLQKEWQARMNNSDREQQAAQCVLMANSTSVRQQPPIQKKDSTECSRKGNETGLPSPLKTGMESLSGLSLDDVRVHRNSAKPAQLQAHAFAQGTDIHLGPGQEKHLPHEAWHVVQQKQGRVKPTLQMKGGVHVNDDAALEKEADLMGARSLQMAGGAHREPTPLPKKAVTGKSSVQQFKDYTGPTSGVEIENPISAVIKLENITFQGVMAEVIDLSLPSAPVIADVSTDMGTPRGSFTIENRTKPVANSDTQGIRQRRAALALAARALREAAHEKRAMEDLTDTEHNLKLVVREHRHIVKSSRKRGRKGVQVTKGVSWSTMVADAPRLAGIFTEARGRWMSYYGIYSDHLQQKYSDRTFNPGVVELYGMLGSLLHFYMEDIDRTVHKLNIDRQFASNLRKKAQQESMDSSIAPRLRGMADITAQDDRSEWQQGIGGKGVRGGELSIRPNLVDPQAKNVWGLLPKIAPVKWLDGLQQQEDRQFVRWELGIVPDGVNPIAWRTIYGEIITSRGMLAGHPVPDFTINNECGFAFEVRSAKQEDRALYGI